jgi:hypothetical protein
MHLYALSFLESPYIVPAPGNLFTVEAINEELDIACGLSAAKEAHPTRADESDAKGQFQNTTVVLKEISFFLHGLFIVRAGLFYTVNF